MSTPGVITNLINQAHLNAHLRVKQRLASASFAVSTCWRPLVRKRERTLNPPSCPFMQLHFAGDAFERPVEVFHHLKLFSDEDANGKKPVLSETYEVIYS